MIWLADAGLQFQPYMFTNAFVRNVILPTADGNPVVVAAPIRWSASLMMSHIVLFNAAFATVQLLLGLGLLWRPAVKAALVGTVVWALAVWWLGEGLGGVLSGTADPLGGAPGAAVLYVLAAMLAWPADPALGPNKAPRAASVATSGPLGIAASRALWAGLWAILAGAFLKPATHSPNWLSSELSAARGGEPGWLKSMDVTLSHALAHHGIEASIVLAVLCALAAATVGLVQLTRTGLVTAAVVATTVWLAQDFGGILTGQGTDPNTGLLLIILAAAFWPTRTGAIAKTAFRPGSAMRMIVRSVSSCGRLSRRASWACVMTSTPGKHLRALPGPTSSSSRRG